MLRGAWQGVARAKGRRRTCSSLRRSSSCTPLCSSRLSSVSAGARCPRCAFEISAGSLRRLGSGASNAVSRDGCAVPWRDICWRSWRLRWSSSATCLCCPSVCTWRAMRWMQQAAAAASASSMVPGPFEDLGAAKRRGFKKETRQALSHRGSSGANASTAGDRSTIYLSKDGASRQIVRWFSRECYGK